MRYFTAEVWIRGLSGKFVDKKKIFSNIGDAKQIVNNRLSTCVFLVVTCYLNEHLRLECLKSIKYLG